MSSSAYYEALWRDLPLELEPSDFELRLRFLMAHLHPGARVLDLGCGDGRFTIELANAGMRAVGVDVAEEALRRARSRQPRLDLRLIDAAGPWPLEDTSFDAVWAGEVIEHVADTAAWMSELRRVLRSGGSVLVSTPAHGRLALARLALSRRAFAEHFDPLGDHLRYYSADTLTALLEGFGFEHVRVSCAGGPPGARRLLLAHALRSRF
ncbi:MAG TPA: class I SAM-dependent methyltransferase [Solirubrobacteraceae bacterium]|jgi:SAM-dependent methyltransferase|nr:class I SAM-dependent methyltransferase [Solirubrobacteraceae bacterium]